MGTSDFAVPTLHALVRSDYDVVGVVTAPDKEAGRGRKIRFSPVKEFALENDLNLLHPEKLKYPKFLKALETLNPDLQVVVAFRMLPREVWSLPNKGTINLHASLLPQYRGAAPINHAIINGETKTGLTTFFIDEKIDTGSIIRQIEADIDENELFGELYYRLRDMGPELVLKTVDEIFNGEVKTFDQTSLSIDSKKLNPAPKIFKEYCEIDFKRNIDDIHNFIRGLSPFPAAHTTISDKGGKFYTKIFKTKKELTEHALPIGKLITDGKTVIKVAVKGGFLHILELQLAGKRKMTATDFLNGFKPTEEACFY